MQGDGRNATAQIFMDCSVGFCRISRGMELPDVPAGLLAGAAETARVWRLTGSGRFGAGQRVGARVKRRDANVVQRAGTEPRLAIASLQNFGDERKPSFVGCRFEVGCKLQFRRFVAHPATTLFHRGPPLEPAPPAGTLLELGRNATVR